MRRLLTALRPHLWVAAIVMICVLIMTAGSLLGPWLVREIVGNITAPDADTSDLTWIAALLIAVYVIRSLAGAATFHFSHVVAFRTCRDLRDALHAHLMTLSPAWFSARASGDTVSRVVRDSLALEPLLADAVYGFVASTLTAIGVVIILMGLNPELALIALIPMPIAAALLIKLGLLFSPAFEVEAEREGDLNALTQDQISGMREIQIFGQEGYEKKRFGALSEILTRHEIRARMLMSGFDPLVQGAMGLSTALVVLVGGRMAMDNALSVEDLVAFLLYIAALYMPLYSMLQAAEAVQRGMASLGRINEVMDAKPDVADPVDGQGLTRARGDIAFNTISFAYGTGEAVLHDIDLSVGAGQVLALVGRTGAGKTTLASMVARLHDPVDGAVTLDGRDLRDYRLADLRAQVAVVSQDVFLFNGTVRENIRFGCPSASDTEVTDAARAAHALEFIEELPQGFDTEIGERGVRLSGGQKQRLSIARAILKDAPILVLDEATSAVDSATEALIQQSLHGLRQGRTVIVIAHRLSTVRDADCIAVLENGRVIEQGAPAELLAQGGAYARLVRAQDAKSSP